MESRNEMIRKALMDLTARIREHKALILVLSALVVVFITYSLVLPAFTLEKEEAEKQGGIELASHEEEIGEAESSGSEKEEKEKRAADEAVEKSAEEKTEKKDDKEAKKASESSIPENKEREEDTSQDKKEEKSQAAPILEAEGKNYRVEIAYEKDARVPDNSELTVERITKSSEDYDYNEYIRKAEELLEAEKISSKKIRLFDISINDENGDKVEIAAPVSVDMTVENFDSIRDDADLKVIHFAGDREEAELVEEFEIDEEESMVSFEADGFSVYAIVEDDKKPMNAVEIDDIDYGSEYYISIVRNNTESYATTNIVAPGTKDELTGTSDVNEAGRWYFESAGTGQVYIYMMDGEEKKYMNVNSSNRKISFSDTPQALNIEKTSNNSGTFYIYITSGGSNYALSVRGSQQFFFEKRNNGANTNERVILTRVVESGDPYGLDGKTYGIAYHNDGASAAALMAETKDDKHLVAKDMVMKPDVLDNDGILLVSESSDITMWTFHNTTSDKYKLSTEIDGETKYLRLNGQTLSLADEDQATELRVVSGSTDNAGKFRFQSGSYNIEINLSGNDTGKGFWGSNQASGAIWMNLVEKTALPDSAFTLYTARKVSVSDEEHVYDKVNESGEREQSKVVIYTRVWDETERKYVFYAVDHDGSLIRCYDAGDNIEWIGDDINTALWEFTEYKDDGAPNYFYELQNTQYGNYIAPQLTGGQVFSDDTLGVNLNGRRYGRNYTTIIAWDDMNYSYSGLKVKDGHVVSCPLAEADDFYFAIMTEKPQDEQGTEQTTTVETVDNDMFGIQMKMIDFNNPIVGGNRDSVQNAFMGSRSYQAQTADTGLLSTDLKENGYPMTTDLTGHNDSFSELFNDMTPVNHLFIQSIYNESGYFEFDSTQNFAHLNDDGNFKVYNELAAIGTDTGETRTHGQFMPYNDITPGVYALDSSGRPITNLTDVKAAELPDTNPRKGEQLYSIPQNDADYFFGMELSASFTQTASGLDAWGHDIIFEFSGDDDFWLYVDGELVLDLGGIHRALTGSVNFRTGEVVNNTTNTTLYEVFKKNYQARGMSNTEIQAKLDEIFTQNENGQYVFKDYTSHEMKVFYMERGAGASNLHMRFNLAAVKPGTFILSKKLSGTDNPDNDLITFPYQIYYTSSTDGRVHRVGDKSDSSLVKYAGSNNDVTYRGSYAVTGVGTYKNVFLLKPGESAEVTLPEDALDNKYYVVECGVDPDVYDSVTVNGEAAEEVDAASGRKDYRIAEETLKNRSTVEYENHVKEGSMRNLTIEKYLYDSDGETRLHYPDDPTLFSFRLYLGNENADPDNLETANMYKYYVKDPEGNYCRYDGNQKKFVSLGIKEYSGEGEGPYLKDYLESLSAADREQVVFHTSMYGSISRIPADYTVEVRDLIAKTKWMVQERASEIPRGYTLRLEDGYQRVEDEAHYMNTKTEPIVGVIEAGNDPEIKVSNQKGWGLTVNKEWTDKDFMAGHDDIYFAVYVKSGETSYEMVPDTVRVLKSPETQVYYFFANLQSGIPFKDYEVREVVLTGDDFVIDEEGYVTGFDTVTPIEEGGALVVGGTTGAGEHKDGYRYTVSYEIGEQTSKNENVRTDTVTNSRPGIKLIKTDWNGDPVGGAVFTLKDENGDDAAGAYYTSRMSDGLVTIAYLKDGTYYLEETATPKYYIAMPGRMAITVETEEGADGKNITTVTASGVDESLYDLTSPDGDMAATIRIKNRESDLVVKKVDSRTDDPIEGVHFALYRQVTDVSGNKVKDYTPIAGYEDLVTGADGIVPDVTAALRAGTYYLEETRAAEGYDGLDKDICFTIGADGTVKVESSEHAAWLIADSRDEGFVHYRLTIPNGPSKKVSFEKVDIADQDVPLAGAKFDMYRVTKDDDDQEVKTLKLSGMTSGEDGMLAIGDTKYFDLGEGTYHLVETEAPSGYELKAEPVVIHVTDTGSTVDAADKATYEVTYDEGTQVSESKDGITYDSDTKTYTMLITNKSGVELPSAGGIGTTWIYITGLLLTLGCAITLIAKKRV